ncbi:HAD family hydrolase [Halovenus carboxidivorans]|uniref:HAD family hydrolase n=1 Tax=Halovenus carboxidivorans TaxID=2692199 RepID=UPI0034A239F4
MTEEYEAVVYDLDGTLARLAVDWEQVRDDVASKLRAREIDVDEKSLWELFEYAHGGPLERTVEEAIQDHEREGARRSERLALADELPLEVPVGVCSLNCEAACRIALEIHGLDRHVEAIVGRDSISAYKPDPEPLLETIRSLGVAPTEALFVGDSDSDELAADRAGVDFQYVSERLDDGWFRQ